MRKWLHLARSLYHGGAEVVFDVLLLILAVNLVGAVGLWGRDALKAHGGDLVPDNPWVQRAKAYPDMSPDDVYRLHMETWERQLYEYEPLAQFKERAFSGSFVNVSEHGFRKNGHEQPWPPDKDAYTIFVFGGSTTFSYGLPDAQAVPVRIEAALQTRGLEKADVYNFGRAYFFSTHELLQFQALLMDGIVPDAAIFVDGVNDFYYHRVEDKYLWTQRLHDGIEAQDPSTVELVGRVVQRLPAYEFGAFLVRHLSGPKADDKEALAEKSIERIVEGARPENLTRVLERYRDNKRLIETLADHYGVKVAFVWQPSPLYGYDLAHHLFADRIIDNHKVAGNGYEVARQWRDQGAFGPRFVWCADIQEGVAKPLYVDAMHYSAEMADMLAQCVADGTKGLAWSPPGE